MKKNKRDGIAFVVSAPSGSGKTTLLKQLRKALPFLKYSVSYTTRAPRSGEKNKRDYCFVSEKKFNAMIKQREFLEYAKVYGNFYGTSLRAMRRDLKAGYDVLLDLDTQGAKLLKEKIEVISIFVIPPSFKELEHRLKRRDSDEEDSIAQRLSLALTELACIKNYDYLVVNDKLKKALHEVKAIIQAERCRVERQKTLIARLKRSFRGKNSYAK